MEEWQFYSFVHNNLDVTIPEMINLEAISLL